MKKLVRLLLPGNWYSALSRLKNRSPVRIPDLHTPSLLDKWAIESYSQEGEDMILKRIFENHGAGFYVDVGAYHPKRFSNTYYFYKRGWHGINIDAMPGSMAIFSKTRPRDINIEAAIAKENTEKTFYIFNEGTFSSFDETLARSRVIGPNYIVSELKIITKTLKDVLLEHIAKGQLINFLTIDVEGYDLEVLQSNDWKMFRPQYVLVECFGMSMNEIVGGEIYKLLCDYGYTFFAKTVNTVIFKDTLLI
jgi:FkbM family methyltransferase